MRSGTWIRVRTALFLSGAAGLVYELVWIRRLSFLTGSGSYALAATLVAFMGGMALGGWWLGIRADRPGSRPFRTYTLLQAGILIGAAASFLLQPLLTPVFTALYRTAGPGPLLTISRFIGAIALLGIPTVLMGATLPVMVRGVAEDRGVGPGVASLYSVNTLGGIVGVLLSGFLLMPLIGTIGTFLAGSALTVAAALVSLGIREDPHEIPGKPQVSSEVIRGSGTPGSERWLLVALLVGTAMLAAEVLWSRSLVSGPFNNTYAVATMLASVLAGIVIGSRIVAGGRPRGPRCILRLLLVLTVWIPLTGLLLREGLPMLERSFQPGSLAGSLLLRYLPAFLLLLPASVTSGMLFPLIVSRYSPSPSGSGGGVGRVLGANTAGAVLGSVLCTFVALPLLGLRWSFAAAAVLTGGAILSIPGTGLRLRSLTAAGSLAVLVLLTVLGGSGVWIPDGFRLLYHDDSPGGDVTVIQNRDMPSAVIVSVGGSQASTTTPEGCLKNRLMAYFPLMVHPAPENVCVICFGTGITAGTAALFPSVRMLDCVEINPSVTSAAENFSVHNHEVLSSPSVELIIEDGRNHLMGTDRWYDVITEEPMHPALAGVVSLYTREYYQLAWERLNPGGVMSQWLPLYAMSDADCRMVVATFIDVFPNSALWLLGRDAMITGRKSMEVDPMTVVGHLSDPVIAADLAPFGLHHPEVFLATYVMGPEELRAYAGSAPVVTDCMPVLEYSAPSAVFGVSTVAGNLDAILEYRSPPEGAAETFGEDFQSAWDAVELFHKAESARDRFILMEEAGLLQEAVDICPRFRLAGRRLAASLHQSAGIMLQRGNPETAWNLMNQAFATGEGDALMIADLSAMETTLGLYDQALIHASAALDMEPSSAAIMRAYGKAALGSGDPDTARWALGLADSLELN